MSFKAFVWAWDQPLAKDEHLIVLLALADIANDAGVIRASQPYIAKKCRKTERTVRRALHAMEGTVLTITERPGWVDLITLNIPDEFMVQFGKDQEHAEKRGRRRKRPDSDRETTGHERPNEGAQESDDPIKGTKEGTGVVLHAPEPFEVWWAIYPRKVAKDEARKAWKQMTSSINALGLEELLTRTRLYADHVLGKDAEHIAHGATWLRGRRWTDELPDRSQTDGRRAGGADPGAERNNARVEAMVAGARQALDPRRRQRWSL